jgi:GntR family transcriptional regulator, transcriptional repressor for pyruvate dehydrogenase complex
MKNQSQPRVRRLSVVDEVFQDIQARIHSGELPIGHLFPPQKILAQEMGVSSSTIRVAINKLIMMGYLSTKPGVGTTVVSRSASSFVSNYGSRTFLHSSEVGYFMEARLYLEKASIRSAVRQATDEDIKKMEEYIEGQKRALKAGDIHLFSTLDTKFHLTLMAAGRNPLIIKFMEIIRNMLFTFITEANQIEGVMDNVTMHHEAILAQLKLRDVRGTEQKVVEHFLDVVKNIEANLGHDIGLQDLLSAES